MKILRVYADTSVFGGCFDEEFAEPSRAFFDQVRTEMFRLVVSDTLLREMRDAPAAVRSLLTELPVTVLERIGLSSEIDALRDAYLNAGIVGPAAQRDAEHIAAATVADADLIVSWNFKHIVHYEKISGYHGINLLHGYSAIRIFSPLEVV